MPRIFSFRAIIIGSVLLSSYAYFHQGEGWNENSRFDMTRAIVQHHTFRIDAYHQNTGDKAYFGGHYYCDKAPGLSLTAIPIWELVRETLHLTGRNALSGRGVIAAEYLSTIVVVGLPTSLAGVALFLLALEFGASLGGATFGALVFGLATPMWCYATEFWGHATAAALLLFAYATAFHIRSPYSAQHDLCMSAIIGLLAGWATVTDFTSGPAAALIGV